MKTLEDIESNIFFWDMKRRMIGAQKTKFFYRKIINDEKLTTKEEGNEEEEEEESPHTKERKKYGFYVSNKPIPRFCK